MSKILLLEFNEICPPLLTRWMDEGKLPNFAALYDSSQVFTSAADVLDPDYLEPWIQWYSIHTGLPYHEHKVFYLTDGPRADHSDIWHRLHRLGKSVMNCGSMNARALAGSSVFYLPDPWCSNEPAWPSEIEVFKTVMAKLVQESTRGVALSLNELLPFMTFLIRRGLRPDTIRAIVAQLGSERLSQADVKWRRVALADRLQFDLFRYYYRRMHPDFATFFVNSTAHLQHAYWRHMDPDAFPLKAAEHEIEMYGDAVLFGYRSMDALLRRFFALAEADTTIILCSALSQQPFLKREASGGQHFYRVRDIPRFLQMLGIAPHLVEPVMTHQYRFRFADRASAENALAVLTQLRLGEETVFGVRLSGTDIHFGCQIYDRLEENREISGVPGPNERLYFFDLLYAIDAVKSARHHPEGVLWLRTGEHAVHTEPVSILDIAPTIYDLMGVWSMVGHDAIRGISLGSRFRSGVELESRYVA
jgi:Type I phosphodiesterase / nucleotide pyrophosphatase